MRLNKYYCVLLFIPFILSGCMAYSGFYEIGLDEVQRPENVRERYGSSEIVNFEEDGDTKYSYEDEMIKIVWLPLSTQFAFVLENKTDNSIKIIWDEAVYVDENGSSSRVMHAGVKYTDRNTPQPPTVVVRNSKLEDLVSPTDKISYVSGQYGGWVEAPLFPNRATSEAELNSITQEYIGSTVRVILPLEIEGTVNEYTFLFEVKDFIKQ